MSDNMKNSILWAGIGAGLTLVLATIILLFSISIQKHYPLSYGTEPYGMDAFENERCLMQTHLIET